jgi:hypothetical protein
LRRAGSPIRRRTRFPPEGVEKWAEEHGRLLDEYDFEPILYLVEHGHLTDEEISKIRADATDR